MNRPLSQSKSKASFGTAPVFLTAISTILGAIMFLRFGYAVGNLGFIGALIVIVLGHLVTIPTAMAVAEIATNRRVEGGGEYYIISRSFGLNIGAAIGIALYLSQGISVAFYIIAFSQAFDPVFGYLNLTYGLNLHDKRIVSIPALLLLIILILTKGADLGVKMLYFVVTTLLISLSLFFAGEGPISSRIEFSTLIKHVDQPAPFFYVFAICFPAFTGMTAGVGLSGDLRNPKKSIPLGTLSATIVGMTVYVLVAYKLAAAAKPEELVNDQLVMSKIALWGPIIPIGLACATLSSALGSYLVAPRTLQAIARDKVLPMNVLNTYLAKGKATNNEPFNASMVTGVIAIGFTLIGDVDFVAEIISMFFMVTYGSICFISFLQHFAADPSYRPAFRSRWYISLLGALMCLWLMFKMNPFYAILALVIMALLYVVVSHYNQDKKGLAAIFQGGIFQLSRKIQVFLQKAEKDDRELNWRPSIVCVSQDSFQRLAAFDLLRWISHRYGFGTYIHYINGYLSVETHRESEKALDRLIRLAGVSHSNVYIDTLVSPSYTSAIAQIIQLPGISGKENNMIMFEYARKEPEVLQSIMESYALIKSVNFDICVLRSTERGFAYKSEIHIWITSKDYDNANLMILLAYILLGHPDWSKGIIRIFVVFPKHNLDEHHNDLLSIIETGRLPISPNNVEVIEQTEDNNIKRMINQNSVDADLTIIGVRGEMLKTRNAEAFTGYDDIGNILFVNTTEEKEIK